jgi:histidine ammonia-lyase
MDVELTEECWESVRKGREVVEKMLKLDKPVYGLNTGFGSFATVKISSEDVHQLQINLIRSHSCGVGVPLPLERVREIHLLRINVLSHGCSGIR